MGLLVEGKALSPEETKEYLNYIREHGITQFLITWKRVKDLQGDELKFGDEIECGVFVLDNINKTVKMSARGAELRKILSDKEQLFGHESEGVTWHPEFGGWMIESTPSRPYSNYVSDLLRVERNMILRRRRLISVLAADEIAPYMTCFPMLGVGDFISNPQPFSAPYSQSVYIPDYVINPHPRFAALTQNIRSRRGSKVNIQVPLFRDTNTPEFAVPANGEVLERTAGMEEDTNIHMDCQAFGMGMCCLQVTFQATNVDESRYMYDQLAVLAPIMLALTAGTPIFKGRLSDIDARWTAIAQCVDDRTPAERGELSAEEAQRVADPRMAGGGIRRIPKSRYDSISTYIYHCKGDSACQRTFEIYNDVPCPVDEEIKLRLRSEGLDENLAQHVAHLFVRDPIVAFSGQIDLNDEETTDHFESLQSTNWQTCRWKPPPPRHTPDDPHIGWRTEFRSMEVQLTDFENAAFVVFIALITRVVLAFDLGFYIPLSKVDENMHRAHLKNAVVSQLFFFRKHIAPPDVESSLEQEELPAVEKNDRGDCGCKGANNGPNLSAEDSCEEMTMEEIFNGKGSYFPGLLPLVYSYLDYIQCDAETYRRVDQYLQFIEKRSKGELVTPATWIRQFVQTHPAYKQDSVVSPEIAHDLMLACKEIGEGTRHVPELLGNMVIERVRKEDAYGQVLAGRLSSHERCQLVKKLIQRAGRRPDHIARGKLRTGSNL